MSSFPLSIALVHWPCVDRAGEVYATSLTNLDLHDIARSARTYDVRRFYVVHPVDAQRDLARSIAAFWERQAAGKNKNPDRSEALRRVRVVASIEDAIADDEREGRGRPRVLATSARSDSAEDVPEVVGFESAREQITGGAETLILFGTGHGLAAQALGQADGILPPIRPSTDYNHLSVRSAVAIMLDRLLADAAP